jgi:peptidylprolyl isomerase
MDRRVIVLIVSAAALAVVVAIVLIARGGSDSGSNGGPDLTDTSKKPVVEVPSGPPPTTLETKDIVTGDGPAAQAGDQLTVQYVGVDYQTGKEFDTSWGKPQPFKFQLGGGQVIPGWDQGVAGMKVGGRRELIIPPNLAYGAQGQPPAIGPNATLIFVIDLVSIGSGAGG